MPFTDLHNHLVPAVDDGAQTEEEARDALGRMREDGITTIITTPHLDASLAFRAGLWEARLKALDTGWERLVDLVGRAFPEMAIHKGVELKLDTPEPDLDDERVRLAGGPFVLTEFPYMSVPPRSAAVIEGLRTNGAIPIIAHPERYGGMEGHLELAGAWRSAGAYLQVNAGSVVGRYGREARRVSLALLRRGWVDYLSSDYHARGPVSVRDAHDALEEMGASREALELLMEENPERVIRGEPPLPVPMMESKQGLWARITERFT